MASKSTDNSDSEASNDSDQLPTNESSLDYTRNHLTGLRRRRRSDAARSQNGRDDTSTRQDRARDSATSHHTNSGPVGGTILSHHQNAGLAVGGTCGIGAVGGLSSTAEMASRLGASRLTPLKTPSEIVAKESSATISGETAESTAISSPQSMGQRGRRSAPNLRRQYRILESQAYLLLGTTSIGFVLFLIFTLPFFALISLTLIAASLAALVPVASSALRTRYQMELEHPLGLLRHFPDSIRIMLTETTLHEYMTDTTAFMENRYLLLYFVPGLQPDQLMNFINQLPPRHRNALLQPGLGRLVPSIMGRFMRMDGSLGESGGDATPLLQNGGRGDMSTSSLLTLDREEMDHTENRTDMEVSLLEAIRSLRQTVTGQLDPDALATTQQAVASVEPRRILGEDTTTSSVRGDEDDIQDDHNSSSMLGEGVGLTGVVLVPQPTDLDSDQNAEQRRLQQEYDIEGRVLSEATSVAVANYSAQAAAAVSDSAGGAVEAVSSLIIRIGSVTGLVAGSGTIALAAFARPSYITLGLFTLPGTRNATNSSDQRNDSVGTRRVMMYGLLATSAFGFLSAGLSYFIRNRVRAAIAANREESENKAIESAHIDDIDSTRKGS